MKSSRFGKRPQSNVCTAKFVNVYGVLEGQDGNAFAFLGRVSAALERGGATAQEIKQFTEEATSGDYAHLLATVHKWIRVENPFAEDLR